MDRWLALSDVIVAVSDTMRQFEGKEESDMLQRFAAQKPVLVLNHVDLLENGQADLDQICGDIDVRFLCGLCAFLFVLDCSCLFLIVLDCS